MARRGKSDEVALSWVAVGDLHAATARPALLDALCADLAAVRGAGPSRLNLALLAGDLVDAPSPQAYERAFAAVERVCDAAGIDPSCAFAVPGNHDVHRGRVEDELEVVAMHDAVRARPSRIDRVLAERPAALAPPFAEFRALAARLGQPSASPGWPGAVPTTFVHRLRPHMHAVRLVGWNTALVSDEADAPGALAVPRAMLYCASDADDDEVVVVLAHHPMDWLADGDVARAAIDAAAHVYLHAHAHDAVATRPARTPRGMLTLSVGRRPGEPGEGGEGAGAAAQLRYAVCQLELGRDGPVLRVWARSSALDAPRFGPDLEAYGPTSAGEFRSWVLPVRPPGEGWLSARRSSVVSIPALSIEAAAATRAAASEAPRVTVPPASLPCTLPAGPGGAFVGRLDVLRALAERLEGDGAAAGVRVAALVGAAGDGKSALARAYASAAIDRGAFPGAVLWFDAGSPESLDASWRLAAAALRAPAGDAVAWGAIADGARSRGRALVVLDGVRAPAVIAEACAALEGAPVAVLYTTTDVAHAPAPGVFAARLGPLALDDAIAQLARASGGVRDTASLGRVAKLLGRNPLALEVAGRLLPAARTAAHFADDLQRSVRGMATGAAAVYPLFDAVWAQAEGDARVAWLVASLGAPEAPALVAWLDAATRALLADAAGSAARVGASGVGELDPAAGTLRLHGLAHAYGRAQLRALDDAAQGRLAGAFARGGAVALEDALGRNDRAACARALPHLDALLAALAHAEPDDVARASAAASLAAVRAGGAAHVARVRPVLDRALVAITAGDPARRAGAIELLEAAVAHDRARDASGVAANEVRLAVLLRASGSRDALDRARQLLQGAVAREAASGADPWRVADVRAELGAVLVEIGTVEALHAGRAQLTEAIAAAEGLGEAGAPLVARARARLAELEEALKFAQAAGLRR